MIDKDELRKFQANFEPVWLDKQREHTEREKLRRTFEERFPRSEIHNLTLDQYVQGKGSKRSFCYWVEWKTAELGHIQGSPSIKFGVYFDPKNQVYKFTKKFKSESEALHFMLNEIGTLLDAAENNDIEAVRQAQVSEMFKGKILFLYFPEKFINIFSERHVDHFLSNLRLTAPRSDFDQIAKKELLIKFKNEDELMKDWKVSHFCSFLYHFWHPPARDAEVPAILKDYTHDFPLPEQTEPQFIDLALGQSNRSDEPATMQNRKKIDFEQKNLRNKLTGNQGEDIVYLAEKRKLEKCGKLDLASKVKAVCKEDDGLGYDILSYEPDGQEKHIEVKSSVGKVPSPNNDFRFYLSATEYSQAQKLENYYLYVVFDVKSKQPKILCIKNPAKLYSKFLILEPSAYYATITAA